MDIHLGCHRDHRVIVSIVMRPLVRSERRRGANTPRPAYDMPTHASIHRSRNRTRISPRRDGVHLVAAFHFRLRTRRGSGPGRRHRRVRRPSRHRRRAAVPRGALRGAAAGERRRAVRRGPRVDRQGQGDGRRPALHEHPIRSRSVGGRADVPPRRRCGAAADGDRRRDARRPVDTAARRRTARQDADHRRRRPYWPGGGADRQARLRDARRRVPPERLDGADAGRRRLRSRHRRSRPRRCGRPISSACSFPACPPTRTSSTASGSSLLQPHAWLINTARGAVVDEVALYDALVEQRHRRRRARRLRP